MRMYNLDGSEGMMCGNGIRCVAKYVYDSGIAKKDVLHIETKSGIKTCRVHVENGEVTTVTVDMGKAELVPAKIPVDFPGDTAVKEKITVLDKEYEVTCVSMGNPHCVIFGKDPDMIDLEKIGPHFEHFEKFPERINTEFIEVLDNHTLKNARVGARQRRNHGVRYRRVCVCRCGVSQRLLQKGRRYYRQAARRRPLSSIIPMTACR